MSWTDADRAEVIRLWKRYVPAREIAAIVGHSQSGVRHLIRRHYHRKRLAPLKPEPHIVLLQNRPALSALAERDRRLSLPDTLESFFGDPKPGSGQSALEQMRR